MRTSLPSHLRLRAVAHGRARSGLDAVGRAFLRWQTRRALTRLHALSDCRLAWLGLDRREIEADLCQMLVQSHSAGEHARNGRAPSWSRIASD